MGLKETNKLRIELIDIISLTWGFGVASSTSLQCVLSDPEEEDDLTDLNSWNKKAKLKMCGGI